MGAGTAVGVVRRWAGHSDCSPHAAVVADKRCWPVRCSCATAGRIVDLDGTAVDIGFAVAGFGRAGLGAGGYVDLRPPPRRRFSFATRFVCY